MSETKETRKKRGKSIIKRAMNSLIVAAVNRIRFVDLVHRIACSKAGRPFLERFEKIPETWANAHGVSRIAVDLTVRQLNQEGEPVNRSDIEALINEIAIRYDRKIHVDSASAIGLIFNHLFDHQNPEMPFTSPDGRDLKHLDELKALRSKGFGVVYLINHSSHLDEFLVDILWQNLGMGLPVFAAGQNMMAIKSIEEILMVGSYVVLRQGASRHQVAALFNYCSAVSRAGEQQGIFLEAWRGGARTRDGSLRYPKRLVTLKGAIDVDQDMVIQPVALSYSAVPEDLMMCSRKSGWSWVRGMGLFRTLAGFVFHPRTFVWRAAENLYGRAYITVPPPMLLSQLKEAHAKDRTGIDLDEFIALSSIREIARNKKVMASHLTARGLLQARKQGSSDLKAAVRSERESIRDYHRTTFGEEPDFEDFITSNTLDDVIADGLKTLKKRGVVKRFFKDPLGLPRVKDEIALSYYATHGDRRLYSPTADQNIVVVGAGNWGFAIASILGNRLLEDKKYNNASITIFDSRPEVAKLMGLNRQGPGRFAERVLPKNVFVTSDIPSAFRKASEVIIASKPDDLENHVREMLAVSEQPMKIIVGTRGFVPKMNCLPFTAVRRLVSDHERRDIDILSVAGPLLPEDLIEAKSVRAILAGSMSVLDDLSDLFHGTTIEMMLSTDPIGVQAADILARIYAMWVNYIPASKRGMSSADVGFLVAAIAREACELALALGADPESFSAGSVAWNATFVAVSMSGPWHDFGRKAGASVRKGKDPESVVAKLNQQWINDGTKLQALADIPEVLTCAEQLGVDMPILKEMGSIFLGMGSQEG
ncbi:MAG: 1-acyl-sn-glycerol-3-phosphate acyltransferase [Pseudomonadota bacterium]